MTPHYRDHRIYLVHLLRVLHRRGASAPGDVYDEVADLAGVTEVQREVPGKEVGWNPVYRNRIQFARQALVDAGLVVGSSDPKLDAQIRKLAAEGLSRRTKERQESLALAGLEAERPTETEEPESERAPESDEAGPTVQELAEEANDAVLRTMLDHVRGMSDRAFEHLVGTALKAALRAEAVTITQRSRDGGVDGVLHFDALWNASGRVRGEAIRRRQRRRASTGGCIRNRGKATSCVAFPVCDVQPVFARGSRCAAVGPVAHDGPRLKRKGWAAQ